MVYSLWFHKRDVDEDWRFWYAPSVSPLHDAHAVGTLCVGGETSFDFMRSVDTPYGVYSLKRFRRNSVLYFRDEFMSRVKMRCHGRVFAASKSCGMNSCTFSLHGKTFRVMYRLGESYIYVRLGRRLVGVVHLGVMSDDSFHIAHTIYAESELALLAAVLGVIQFFSYTLSGAVPNSGEASEEVFHFIAGMKESFLHSFWAVLGNAEDRLYVLEQLSSLAPGALVTIPNIMT